MVTPVQRRNAMMTLVNRGLSKSAATKVLGWSRAVACYPLKQPVKDAELRNRITAVSQRFPRFGYRRIAA
jgi:putative transposase